MEGDRSTSKTYRRTSHAAMANRYCGAALDLWGRDDNEYSGRRNDDLLQLRESDHAVVWRDLAELHSA
jgi:hypothetical protein